MPPVPRARDGDHPAHTSSAVLLLILPLLAGCGLPSESRHEDFERGVVSVSIPLSVMVADSLFLACPPGAAADSAHHWIASESSVRLDPEGTTELAFLAEDLPENRTGTPRCGGEPRQTGVRRGGTYAARPDEVVVFTWDPVSTPDTSGIWVTSEEAWIGDGIPLPGRRLSALMAFQGVETPVILGFPLLGGP